MPNEAKSTDLIFLPGGQTTFRFSPSGAGPAHTEESALERRKKDGRKEKQETKIKYIIKTSVSGGRSSAHRLHCRCFADSWARIINPSSDTG